MTHPCRRQAGDNNIPQLCSDSVSPYSPHQSVLTNICRQYLYHSQLYGCVPCDSESQLWEGLGLCEGCSDNLCANTIPCKHMRSVQTRAICISLTLHTCQSCLACMLRGITSRESNTRHLHLSCDDQGSLQEFLNVSLIEAKGESGYHI